MSKQKSYHENFIAGIKLLMAKEKLETTKAAAEYLGIPYMSMWKIIDGTNKPTVEHGIVLCRKGGFSGNWLFLDKGEVMYSQEVEAKSIMKEIKLLRTEIYQSQEKKTPINNIVNKKQNIKEKSKKTA